MIEKLESLGIVGALLTLLVYVVKFYKAKGRAERAEDTANSWHKKFEYEYEQKKEAQDLASEYRRDEKKRIEKKRDDLAYRDIDLELSKVDSWAIDKD